MCNLYDLGPAPGRSRLEWEDRLREALESITYVAPGKLGLVAREVEGEMEPAVMRWGFHRPWSPVINNARDDKLAGKTWNEAWQQRRCLIPVRQFYEWSGPKGSKTKHAIRTVEEDVWFWIAGIWEEHADPAIGLSYTMVTTSANPQMEPLHHRMPLLLRLEDLEAYLAPGEPPGPLVRPYQDELCIEPPPPGPPLETGELF